MNPSLKSLILPVANAALGAVIAVLGLFLRSELADLNQLRADVVTLRESAAQTSEFRRWFEQRIDRLETNLENRIERLDQRLSLGDP